jgi:hypothetical protein
MAAAYDRKAVEAECVQILVRARSWPGSIDPTLRRRPDDSHGSLVTPSKHPIVDGGFDVGGEAAPGPDNGHEKFEIFRL